MLAAGLGNDEGRFVQKIVRVEDDRRAGGLVAVNDEGVGG